MRPMKRLGEMLVDEGLITNDRLQQALSGQRNSGLKLGEYLIHHGLVSESKIVDCISRQLKIEKFSTSKFSADLAVAKLIPEELSRKYAIAPLVKKEGVLVVAMTDPMDFNALDTVEIATNYEVEPVICSRRELDSLLGTLYEKEAELGDTMTDFDDEEAGEAIAATMDTDVHSLQDMAEEAPVIRMVNALLTQAVRDRASDVHISPEKNMISVRFRIDGKLREIPAPPKKFFLPMASRLKILSNMDIAVSRIPQDGRFTFTIDSREINVRASSLPTIYGENIVLRLLEVTGDGLSLDDLGFRPEEREKIDAAMTKPYGMILTTGPTGSGKSTTLYAGLKQINSPDINIITLEDPVEYRLTNIRQVQLNTKAGMTFASGLRSILRQDPDVVMVGEIRDGETASIATQAALTGHLVLSTLHTNDAAGSVTRLLNMDIEPFLVSSSLLMCIAQRLLRRVCKECKEEYYPDRKALAPLSLEEHEGKPFYRGRGCPECNESGYKGRVGVYEILTIDHQIQDMILSRSNSQEIARAAIASGNMRTLLEDAASKVLAGITTLEEAASKVLI